MKVMLDEGAYLPIRAHEEDAGYDLRTPTDFEVPGCKVFGTACEAGSACIDTGVHIQIPAGCVGMIKSKSGLNVRENLTAEGVIDAGYTGSIVVKLYNHSFDEKIFYAGDKIAQLVILPIVTPDIDVVNSLEPTARGDDGFGSTGR